MVGISIKNFGISFGNMEILKNVSLEVNAGEIVTILGSSGSGKSTILRSIASLQDNYEGEILLNETCLISKNECNKDIGYIFQDYALFPHLNVSENIAFSLSHLKKIDRQRKVDTLLKQFDLVEHRNKQIHELSGGQQQRVSIARVIAYEPKILLLDEPFSNLDSILRNKTKSWLKSLIKELGLSAILVTHDQKEALSMSDKIAIINNKTIVQTGTPQELFNEPNSLYVAKFLGDINILPKEVANSFDMDINPNSEVITRVNTTMFSNEKNDFELKIIDTSYCGDYVELQLQFTNYDYSLYVRANTHQVYDLDSSIYLDIKKENLIIIENN